MKEIRLIDFNMYFKSVTDHNLSFDFLAYDLTRWKDDETIRLVAQYFQKLFIRFLKEYDVYTEYVKLNRKYCVDVQDPRWSLFPHMPIDDYVNSAFPWEESKVVECARWWELSDEWEDVLNNINWYKTIYI